MSELVPHRLYWNEARRYGKKAMVVQIFELRRYFSSPEKLNVVLLIEKVVFEDATQLSAFVHLYEAKTKSVTFSKDESDDGNVYPELVRRSVREADEMFAEMAKQEVS